MVMERKREEEGFFLKSGFYIRMQGGPKGWVSILTFLCFSIIKR